jgi:hypothetical protein
MASHVCKTHNLIPNLLHMCENVSSTLLFFASFFNHCRCKDLKHLHWQRTSTTHTQAGRHMHHDINSYLICSRKKLVRENVTTTSFHGLLDLFLSGLRIRNLNLITQ